MSWLDTTSAILYYAFYPLFLVAAWLFYILHWIASPFIYIGYILKETIRIPWRILAQFEDLWYFLAWAVTVGSILGLVIYFTLHAFVVVFDLGRKPVPKPVPATGHDAASYRAARQAKKQKDLDRQKKIAAQARMLASRPLMQEVVRDARQMPLAASSTTLISPGTGRPALLQETILEHTDEEDDDSIF